MLYSPVKVCSEDKYFEQYQDVVDANMKHIKQIEKEAKSKNTILHRFLYESVADGQAIYQIVKENKQTVQVAICSIDGLYYNDYMVPQWGEKATIPKEYAEHGIRCQDAWEEAMNKKNRGGN